MKRLFAWFVDNPVAANLIMIVIVAGGLATVTSIKREVFPEFSMDRVSITVPYLGASPEEVEQAVCLRVEEAIDGIDGIKQVTSLANEGVAQITAELFPEADSQRVLDDIKSRVDAIDTFPEEVEKPVIGEITNRRQVINVAISGRTDERSLRAVGEQVRDEIAALPGITIVELVGVRPYEISIEVAEERLRQYGLTFDAVAQAVQRSSIDLPGGSLRTREGEILLRTEGQAYTARDFEKLPLIALPDGSRLHLGDVARVVDGFAETDQAALFDGQPSVMLKVYRVGKENALDIAAKVKAYIATADRRVPEGIHLTTWQDMSKVLRDRQDLLIRNGRMGFVLVFIILALFLRMRLAFWVSLGIPISFLGGLWLMPTLDVSINLISLFAFIVVLGIIVDDAIVVGENIHTRQTLTGTGAQAAVEGVHEVGVPVIFAVLTTVAAFVPLLNVEGMTGKIMRVIPLIVIPTLLFSLVESLLVLPVHLRHLRPPRDEATLWAPARLWRHLQQGFSRRVQLFVDRVYTPSLEIGLRWRYAVLALGMASLLITYGLVRGSYIKFTFFPEVEADFVTADLTMPQGTPALRTLEAIRQIEAAAERVQRQLAEEENAAAVFRHRLSTVGEQPVREIRGSNGGQIADRNSGGHLGEVAIELAPAEERTISSTRIVQLWRDALAPIPDALELTFSSSLFSPGAPIEIQLAGTDVAELRRAADELEDVLAGYPGVYDVADSFRPGKKEIRFELLPAAESLGLTLSDVARQVRQAFYGEEAQRVQRGRYDVRVMVRYPAEQRRTLGDLDRLRIRTPDGIGVPLAHVARTSMGRGDATIRRVDRARVISVTANVDDTRGNAGEVLASVRAAELPEILSRHPGVSYSLEGQQREQRDTLSGLMRGFIIALVAIYGLMAIPFRSYIQPVVVMTAIPFGLVGAVWGHMVMGMNLTILSAFGAVALTGVVVNDSLVMVDYVNRRRREGTSLQQAVRIAGSARFRPILLTSLTTFAGLTPLLLERSMQAQFLIPLAVSLGFGVIFSTFVTLILVPATYLVLEDIRAGLGLPTSAEYHPTTRATES